MIAFEVLGTPAPKGSSRAILIAGKARNVPSGSNTNRDRLKSWDGLVREQARIIAGDASSPIYAYIPLTVTIEFRIARPSGHWAKRGGLKPSAPPAPMTKPDGDKLARATLDALHGTVFDDDGRIVELVVRKVYAAPGREGARITVGPWGQT